MSKSRRKDKPRHARRDPIPGPVAPAAVPNPAGKAPQPGGPVGLDAVIRAERAAIKESRKILSPQEPHGFHTTALSLSGGGIRSACFNLGLLEGLDRLGRKPESSRPCDDRQAPDGSGNFLELFDYLSSVSGGSYAAGHLATSMLNQDKLGTASGQGEWLGKVQLTSKTVPGWLWGLGVWTLGVVFQLLKTGALMVFLLAFAAFAMRIADAPDVDRFVSVLGLQSDISRGFVPFWLTLWVFLVAYWINSSKLPRVFVAVWLLWSATLCLSYVFLVWGQLCIHRRDPGSRLPLPFVFHFAFLMLLIIPVVVSGFVLLLAQAVRSICRILARAVGLTQNRMPWGRADGHGSPRPKVVPSWVSATYQGWRRQAWVEGASSRVRNTRLASWLKALTSHARNVPGWVTATCQDWIRRTWVERTYFRMRTILLAPLLMALFCVAALVTTGDVELGLAAAPATIADIPAPPDARKADVAAAQHWIYRTALAALGVTSLAFFFPKNLFKSARVIEDRDLGKYVPGFWRRSWEPIFRVVIFLCSYGFILVLIFVVFSTVAGEDISGYSRWREELPSAAFHKTDFKDSDLAWDRISRDAASARSPWHRLASRLLAIREEGMPPWGLAGEPPLSLAREKAQQAKIKALGSMPWIVRLFPPLMRWGPLDPWEANGFKITRPGWRLDTWQLYEEISEQDLRADSIASKIGDMVLRDPLLYEDFPTDGDGRPTGDVSDPKLAADYLERARSLAALEPTDETHAALQAPIRANNRRALRLYLGDTMRDRGPRAIFASVVWVQDQWTRVRIFAIALIVWGLCCAVNVNTFSLQKFYRGHVIDSWVKIPAGKGVKRWLHQTGDQYRGNLYGAAGEAARSPRAPLILINATLEGNRSLGDEPDILKDIFTFSRVAAGSGETGHWLTAPDPACPDRGNTNLLARRSGMDIGNIVTTSGAFLSPGNIANPALSAILHLLNIQTGYWAHDPSKFEQRSFRESLRFHLTQSLGLDCNGDSRFMLTDGAHLENLGLYVLLQRRCSLIVVSDCSQQEHEDEPYRRYDSLIHVLQQAQVDGIEVGPFLNSRAYRAWVETGKIATNAPRPEREGCVRSPASGLDLVRPPDPVKKKKAEGEAEPTPGELGPEAVPTFSQEHYVFAQITYPIAEDGSRPVGLLVYLRPTLTGDEGDSLLHGATSCRFPDDDPIDQFYTPAKMSTYRLLGRHIATELMHDSLMTEALGRILAGKPSTEGPKYPTKGADPDESDRPRKYPQDWHTTPIQNHRAEDCDPSCALSDLACWRRQRLFRPPTRWHDPDPPNGNGHAGTNGCHEPLA